MKCREASPNLDVVVGDKSRAHVMCVNPTAVWVEPLALSSAPNNDG
jgi:hypothetical protein